MEIIQRHTSVKKIEEDFTVRFLTDQDEIKKVYGDVQYGVNVFIMERTLRFKDNVLVLKMSRLEKNRRIEKLFFQKKLEIYYLKFDLNTGNFLTLHTCGGIKRKRNVTIRRNVFDKLNVFCDMNHCGFWVTNAKGDLDNVEMYDAIVKCFGHQTETQSEVYLSNLFQSTFIGKKTIKVPETNAGGLLTKYYPTEKHLKKNKRKLVQSVLDLLGMNDKFTLKIIHKYPYMDLRLLKTLHSLFGGPMYLSNLNDEIFELAESRGSWTDPNINKLTVLLLSQNLKELPELSEMEKGNLIKVLNNINENQGSDPWLSYITKRVGGGDYVIDNNTLYDHFNMINKIRVYDPEIRMNSTTQRTFDIEHLRLSKLVSEINKGYSISYNFDKLMIKDMETPLDVGGEIYKPFILKDENDYKEEGNFMHHCVNSYYDKERSVIVSLRRGEDRWTCEYDAKNGMLIQAKGRFNSEPSEDIMTIISGGGLQDKSCMWARLDKLKCIEQIRTPFKINGVVVEVKPNHVHEDDLPF